MRKCKRCHEEITETQSAVLKGFCPSCYREKKTNTNSLIFVASLFLAGLLTLFGGLVIRVINLHAEIDIFTFGFHILSLILLIVGGIISIVCLILEIIIFIKSKK